MFKLPLILCLTILLIFILHTNFSVLQVKFQVKIAAGCQPMDIITEEANNAGATWIIIDRLLPYIPLCFLFQFLLVLPGTTN